MTTWQEIFGAEPPVRGVVAEFSQARGTFEQMRSDAQTIVDLFGSIVDHGAAPDHLEGQAGVMLASVLTETDGGLRRLPSVAADARDVFDAHHTRLVELEESADAALARARTAWIRRNELQGEIGALSDQVADLEGDLDDADADADADTSSLDTQYSTASGSLSTAREELSDVEGTLSGIYGNDDSEWVQLRAGEDDRDATTIDALDGIDLGDLEDPGWFDKFVGAIADFLGGVLESIANLLEALVTGDWATFFWELKRLFDVALLVLGTIALFTGVGAPLFALAVANFAVTAGLYLTQTPNPQTGETMGLAAVAWSAAGVVMSSAGFLRNINGPNGWRLFTQTAAGGRAANGQFASVLSGTRAPGGIQTMFTNLGRLNTIRAAPVSAHGQWQALATFSRGTPYFTSAPWQRGLMYTDAVVSTGWQGRGVYTGVTALAPGSLSKGSPGADGRFLDHHSGWGNPGQQGTPVFGSIPPPSGAQVAQVVVQMRANPDVHIVPAA